jgi:hypothetical protein
MIACCFEGKEFINGSFFFYFNLFEQEKNYYFYGGLSLYLEIFALMFI